MSHFAAELDLLAHGQLGIVGRVQGSSNLTLVTEVTRGDEYAWAIYKPEVGERHLYDFDPGLHARERAADRVREWWGWPSGPPTLVRGGAPLGRGSLQWFVENDGEHYFTLHRERPATHADLRRIAVFDIVTNNTDRKSGHVLRDPSGRVWAIDHGLCFHADPKLRTVIWEFGGEPVPEALRADLTRLSEGVPDAVADLLHPREVAMLRQRAALLLATPALPQPTSEWAYPWPLV